MSVSMGDCCLNVGRHKDEGGNRVGHTIWVLEEGQDSDECERSVILNFEQQLNKLCKSLALRPFSDFLDYSILSEEYADEPEAANYVDPAEAKATFESLRANIAKGGGKLNPEDRAALLEELDDCLSKIERAIAKGTNIRFAIVP